MSENATQAEGRAELRTSELTLSYPDFAFGPLSASFSGPIVGVVGPNGAGKTTFLSLISGVFEEDSGSIVMPGDNAPADASMRRAQVASAGLEHTLFAELTVERHCALFSALCATWDQDLANSMARDFGLPLRKPLKKLSAGTRVKASLLLAFARRPHVAVFDEPWSALDPLARVELSNALLHRTTSSDRRTPLVFVSSHDLDLVAAVSNELLFILDGKPMFVGTREDALQVTGLFKDSPNVELYRRLLSVETPR